MTNATPNVAEETLAALMCATAAKAAPYLERLEAEDFPRWQHQRIFQALAHVTFPDDHSGFGSVHTQVNDHFLQTGAYRDHDDGLRACLADLVGHHGHVENLEWLTSRLIEGRYREEFAAHGAHCQQHALTAPLEEMDSFFKQSISDLRALRLRITRTTHTNTIAAAKGAAA
ncbi:hypothetical protein MHT86_08465 [Corynebacterium mastitidis]|uniref:hypothetical protein n=1 Tax=Corynebacterium mastitidis TaxID=161890 RepID=UPI001F12B749|nr:hypothetical protein [Corynebacterium mastitidis]MCH6197527.1 hypothetical protein [Corynebacterium mastitidis]